MKKSNCLLEAIKAKLADPKNIKLIKIDANISRGGTHFLWINKKENTVSHCCWSTEDHNRFWYSYKIITISLEDFQRFLVERANRVFENNNKDMLEFLKSWNIPFVKLDACGLGWQGICYSDDSFDRSVPSKEDYEYLTKFFKTKLPVKLLQNNAIRYITFEELLDPKLDGCRYRYVTPLDSDFKYLKIWKLNRFFSVFAGESDED